MVSFVTFLNSNNGLFTLIFSFFVMVSTIVYAILTYILVNETRKMRLIQTEPKIQIVLEISESYVNEIRLNIKNIGQGPAFNINFMPFVITGGENAKYILNRFLTIKAFSSGLNYLGPSQYFNTSYNNILDIPKEDELYDIKIKIEIKYKSTTNNKYNDMFIIDFRELEGTCHLGKPNLFSIAKSLEKIEKDIKDIASGLKKNNIDIPNSKNQNSIELFKMK